MVLTDREIQIAIENDQILVSPVPNELSYSSTSLDLTLSKFFQEWKNQQVTGVEPVVISPATPGYKLNEVLKQYSDTKEVNSTDGYVLEPKHFVLGWTEEIVELPVCSRIAARVEGKSSLARLGIGIHITAPIIHAGFKGPIQLEICNHGPFRIRLLPGMRVCQLIFEQTVGTPDKGYAGQFYGQKSN